MSRVACCFVLVGCLIASAEHLPVNSNCQWPDERHAKTLDLGRGSDRQHLSDDAEFAEDLAIRHADVPGNAEGIAEYKSVRDACRGSLFEVIARAHDVPVEAVRRSLGRRRIAFDAGVILSFALLYGWGAILLTRWLRRIYGPSERMFTVAIMTFLVSTLTSVAGVMLGEEWSSIWEMLRIGNGHMSYRAARIPWTQHRLELFLAGVLVFLLTAAVQRRRASAPPQSGLFTLSAVAVPQSGRRAG